MFSGLALAASEIPEAMAARPDVAGRRHDRGGEGEFRFMLGDASPALPVWLDGRLGLVRWGTRRDQGRRLPCTAWTRLETFTSGGWKALGGEEVVIPANVGFDRVWSKITEGVRGVVARDERGRPVVYVLVEPATAYYQVMTRSPWMPCLIGELI